MESQEDSRYAEKKCPLTKGGSCDRKCAWALTSQEGGTDCAVTVIAMSTNGQTAMMAGQLQAQQQAASRAFMQQVAPGSGPGPLVL